MRYECDHERFSDCWFEVGESWPRGDVINFFKFSGEEMIVLMRSKLKALYIVTENGVIDSPEKFTYEASLDIDVVLWNWFVASFRFAIDDVAELGNELVRRLSKERAEKQATAQDNQEKK